MRQGVDAKMFQQTAASMGLHPFPRPSANATQAYINEYGMHLGPCDCCGSCERYARPNYSKSSPQTCILDALMRMPNFSYKVNSEVLKIELAEIRATATGVTYFDAAAQE